VLELAILWRVTINFQYAEIQRWRSKTKGVSLPSGGDRPDSLSEVLATERLIAQYVSEIYVERA
jgi:hypothetical protein